MPPGCLQTPFLIKCVPVLCYDYAGCRQFVWAPAWRSKCHGPIRQCLQTPFGKDSLRHGIPKVSLGCLQTPFGKDSPRDGVPKVSPGRLQIPFGKDSLRDGVPKVSPGYLQILFGKDSLRHGVPKVSLQCLQTSFGKDSLREGDPKMPPGCLQTPFLIKLVPILCFYYAGCRQLVWVAAWRSKCLGPARQCLGCLQTPFGKESPRDGVPKVPPGCLQTPFGKDSLRDGIPKGPQGVARCAIDAQCKGEQIVIGWRDTDFLLCGDYAGIEILKS